MLAKSPTGSHLRGLTDSPLSPLFRLLSPFCEILLENVPRAFHELHKTLFY